MSGKSFSHSVVATSVALGSSMLYLVAYWGSFDLNPFEFLSLDDMLRTSIYPLFGYVATAVLYLMLFGAIATYDDTHEIALASPLTERPRSVSRRIKIKIYAILAVVATACFAYALTTSSWWYGLYVLALMLALPLGKHIAMSRILSELVPDEPLRVFVAICVLAIPLLSFAHGIAKAHKLIFSRGDFSFVCPAQVKHPKSNSLASDAELRFIGKADDYFFFVQDPDITSVRILKFEDFVDLTLHRSVELQLARAPTGKKTIEFDCAMVKLTLSRKAVE
ncbi:hypothetical protein VVD49_03960 [Uliginosibacterium sp. H3]|uniref:Uncharacterized protein n=1 Tax=Uliginosibacterium silvisoli TaxID=3114758 RepID=A0ABU6JZZ9_9RHOO|nr:hypothetical protein [Uliginosibacterium sp. H3]